jgi:hypothetical protein
MDLNITSSSIKLLTQDIVDMFNGVGAELLEGEDDGDGDNGPPCTRTTPWVLDEVVDLSTVECKDDIPVAGQSLYSAVSVVGEEMRRGHGGEEGSDLDGKTPETRNLGFLTKHVICTRSKLLSKRLQSIKSK